MEIERSRQLYLHGEGPKKNFMELMTLEWNLKGPCKEERMERYAEQTARALSQMTLTTPKDGS